MYRLRARELKGKTMGGKETVDFKSMRKEAHDHKEFQEMVNERRGTVEFTDEFYNQRFRERERKSRADIDREEERWYRNEVLGEGPASARERKIEDFVEEPPEDEVER